MNVGKLTAVVRLQPFRFQQRRKKKKRMKTIHKKTQETRTYRKKKKKKVMNEGKTSETDVCNVWGAQNAHKNVLSIYIERRDHSLARPREIHTQNDNEYSLFFSACVWTRHSFSSWFSFLPSSQHFQRRNKDRKKNVFFFTVALPFIFVCVVVILANEWGEMKSNLFS